MRGILHRDLKPANILIDAQGHPHITDFGLAKLIESDVELTASGAIMGTPAYMSPEQAAGRRGAMTLATDVYGLGAILYALLTGKAPFGGDSVIETLDAVRTRPPEPPTKRNARFPATWRLICLKCLEKNPADRYPTAGALADDLRHWAAGEPVSVRAAGAVERVAKWARRKPTLAAAYTLRAAGGAARRPGGRGRLAVAGRGTARDAARAARDGEATAERASKRSGRPPKRPARARRQPARSSPGRVWPDHGSGPPGVAGGQRRRHAWPCSRVPGPTSAAGSGVTSIASAIPTCSRSRGTPVASIRRRSARTGRGSSPRSHDETAKVWDAKTRGRAPHAQGAHRLTSFRRRSARTGRGSSPRVMTRRRRSGTPRLAPSSSHSRGTPVPSLRRRSAPTARGS